MKHAMTIALAGAALALAQAGAAQAQLAVTAEAPGAFGTSMNLTSGGVETFESLSTGAGQTVAAQFGGISGTYANLGVNSADPYGGAGGTGQYAVANEGKSYTLTLNKGVNYFGVWISALDDENTMTFTSKGQAVGAVGYNQILPLVSGDKAYFGNPQFWGNHPDQQEAYVFVNIIDKAGTFDQITFSEPAQGCGCAFETDNQTIGNVAVSAAPEPTTWAMLVLGLAGVGGAVRGRQRRAPAIAAAA